MLKSRNGFGKGPVNATPPSPDAFFRVVDRTASFSRPMLLDSKTAFVFSLKASYRSKFVSGADAFFVWQHEGKAVYAVFGGMVQNAGASTASKTAKTLLEQNVEPCLVFGGGERVLRFIHEVLKKSNFLCFGSSRIGTTAVLAVVNGASVDVWSAGNNVCCLFRQGAEGFIPIELSVEHVSPRPISTASVFPCSIFTSIPSVEHLYSSLGAHRWPTISHRQRAVTKGEVLFLASDGVSRLVSLNEVARIVSANPDNASAAGQEIAELVKSRSGVDDDKTFLLRIL